MMFDAIKDSNKNFKNKTLICLGGGCGRNADALRELGFAKVTNADKLNRDPENTYGTIVDEVNGISSTTTNNDNEGDMMNSPLIVNQTESINQ